MISLTQNLLGNEFTTTVLHKGSDTKERFESNLSKQPDDWYYRNTEVLYKFNDCGHRCKNLNEIDLSNYILFAGGSIAEGIGVEIEHSYPYIVAAELGCDYYNLSLGASGIDCLFYNLVSWFGTIDSSPKAVIIHWPDPARVLTYTKDGNMITDGAWTSDQTLREFIVLGEETGFFKCRNDLSVSLIEQLTKNTKVVNVYENRTEDPTDIIIQKIDEARDFIHVGNESHALLAKRILNRIR